MLTRIYFIVSFLLGVHVVSNAQQTNEPQIFKVLTFNIHHGSNTDNSFDLHRIAGIINDLKVDLVTLQEIDIRTKRVKDRDILKELAALTHMHAFFAKAMDFNDGEYGVGILSKKPFLNSENIPLPGNPGNEPRTAAKVSIPLVNKDSLIVISTHLDYKEDNSERIMQAKKLNSLASKGQPMILAGDLNAEPGNPEISLLLSKWTAADVSVPPAPTYPSNVPDKKIDYILYYPKNRWKLLEKKVIQDSIASDHNAFFSILELR